jgi:GWxTD domain-containing protein
MTGFEHLVHAPWAKAVGWTLFYSIWEGALAALLLLTVLLALRSARARYACACLALVGMLAGFALTLYPLASQAGGTSATIPQGVPGAPGPVHPGSPDTAPHGRLEDALPWLAPFWLVGVMVFHLHSLAGWIAARRLAHHGVCRASAPWPERLRELSARLRIAKPIALLESCLADVPVVIGWLHPVILVPVGMLGGIPPAQVEAILLHELAHIGRCDYLVNLLQTVVESILFCHPAVWWISGVIRAERENCCDDLVVAASGDRREYAAALTTLEQTRRALDEAALAATGGSLVKRIRRLLCEPQGIVWAPMLSVGILTIVVAGALAAWQASAPSPKEPSPSAQANVSRYTRWLNEDVVYIINDRERVQFQSLQTDPERDTFIEQFWQQRNPTPDAAENQFKAEHYRRIAFANRYFRWGSVPGWKTDRGRIYIVFGPPDEIESFPASRPVQRDAPANDYPVDDWLYHHLKGIGDNVKMEFADEAKTGDYRMTEDPHLGAAHRFVRQP